MNSPMVEVNNAPDNKSGLIFREARFDDHRQITELQARYGLETETQQTWVHLWAGNPAYQDCPNWPIGWVFENENKQIVGYLGNLLSLYELGNQQVTVASTRGLVMDVRYRSYSLSLLGHFFSQKRVDLYLDTTVSPDALKPHEIFRALRVPTGVWDQAFFWITDYSGFSASLLERKQVPRGAKGLRHPLSAGLFLRDAMAGAALVLLGGSGAAWVLWKWVASGFGPLHQVRVVIFFTLWFLLGVQVIFSSFFISMLGISRDTYIGDYDSRRTGS